MYSNSYNFGNIDRVELIVVPNDAEFRLRSYVVFREDVVFSTFQLQNNALSSLTSWESTNLLVKLELGTLNLEMN